jgi:hypothetical protein
LKEGSPLALPTSVFNDSSGLRNRFYWAQLIAIGIVTPLSFVLNKIWTFSAVRGRSPVPELAVEAAPGGELVAEDKDTPAGTA